MPNIKAAENCTNLFNQFNDFSSDQKQNYDNIKNYKYYNIDEVQFLTKLNHILSLSLFHINACFLEHEFELLLDSTCFDVIARTETRIIKNKISS